MTTLAYKDGILATDTQIVFSDVLKATTTKIWEPQKGIVLSCAGDHYCEWRAIQFFSDPNWLGREPIDFRDGDFAGFLFVEGTPYILTGCTAPIPLLDPYFAIGSGAYFAHAAMGMGATAEESVREAMKYDIHTGGNIVTKIIAPSSDTASTPPAKRSRRKTQT